MPCYSMPWIHSSNPRSLILYYVGVCKPFTTYQAVRGSSWHFKDCIINLIKLLSCLSNNECFFRIRFIYYSYSDKMNLTINNATSMPEAMRY